MRRVLAVRAFVLVVLLAVALASCSNRPTTSNIEQGIRGIVVAGPQCPVESATSPCPPRPVVGIQVEIANAGGVVAQVPTNDRGMFVVALDPGSYTVRASGRQNGFMTSRPVGVDVRPGEFVRVTVALDTGIR
jgi:hypothetical protein